MKFETLQEGYHFEGMSVDGDTLWFSDVFDGGVRRLSPDGRVDVWIPERRMIGGILLNADGKVLCSGVGGIVWLDPETGRSGPLVDAIGGVPIRGVNEMIPDGQGGLYFDTLDITAQERGDAMEAGGLYHLDIHGRIEVLHEGIASPNAIACRADGGLLYFNDSGTGTFALDLSDASRRAPPELLLAKIDCDGMALDAEGGLWVTGYTSSDLSRLPPDGGDVEAIATPAFGISNVRFGGADLRDVYITATSEEVMADYQAGRSPSVRGSRIMRARSERAGQPIPRTRFALD